MTRSIVLLFDFKPRAEMNDSQDHPPRWTEEDPDTGLLIDLVAQLSEEDGRADTAGTWPETLWHPIHEARVTQWSIPTEYGGSACQRSLLVQRYGQLAQGSLTATFILSQHDAAVRRLVSAAAERDVARRWLGQIAEGKAFATVGISQLTTSRRLGAQALIASETSPGVYRLEGAMPWVTAAEKADVFITGAIMEDGRQILIALPADRPGVEVRPAFDLAALQASRTAEVVCRGVEITDSDLLDGPSAELAARPGAVGTAGLETSALALGQARAALDAIARMVEEREDLVEPLDGLAKAWQETWNALMANAHSRPGAIDPAQVRSRANSLALSTTQSYLTARKGRGFLRSEPAQRWARQALFFLVWSCPAPIAQAAIRDLAGLCPS
jgi:alkylation response protein AidB-like acyl-CoA dehydrogenase